VAHSLRIDVMPDIHGFDWIGLDISCEHPDWIGLDWIGSAKNGPMSNSDG